MKLKFATFLLFIFLNFSSDLLGQSISYDKAILVPVEDVKVASLDPGVVDQLNVQPGDHVQVGDVLMQLDRDIYAAEAAVGKTSLAVAVEEARNDVNFRFSEMTRALNEKQLEKSLAAVQQFAKSIPEMEIDRLRLELNQSELSIEQASMELDIAKLNVQLRQSQSHAANVRLDRRTVRSPLSGQVVDITVQKGEAVTGGQPIIRIINLDRLRVKASFDVEFAFRVTKESEAYFEIELQDQTRKFPAKIVFVDPQIEPTERVFTVWADIDNANREMLPGLKGKLVIER